MAPLHRLVSDQVKLLQTDTRFKYLHLNRWLTDEFLFTLLQPKLVGLLKTSKALNRAMIYSTFKDQMLRFDGSNFTGIFRFQHGSNKKLFYCITNKGEQVDKPITSPLWEKKVREAEQGMARENRQTATELLDPDNNATTTDEPLAEPTGQSNGANQNSAVNQSSESSSDIPDAKRVKRQTAAEEIASRSYWLSDEAICLFAPKGNETADAALERRIEILGRATGSNEGWREIVKGHDPDNLCSDNDIFELRQRCMLLNQAYRIALEKMNDWTWEKCCVESCTLLNPVGITQATSGKVLMLWNRVLRTSDCFPHPNPVVASGKKPGPPILVKYPELKNDISRYCLSNLSTLSLELVHEHVTTKMIPVYYELWKAEEGQVNVKTKIDDFLESNQLVNLSLTTIWRWMSYIGFAYSGRKKSYYVDGHEREDVVKDRNQFCERYLTEYEPRCRVWIQIAKAAAEAIPEVIVALGHVYPHPVSGAAMVEFHVDVIHDISQFKAMPREMSVRAPAGSTELAILGQDECVFHQYLLPSKTWVGPNGERPLLPKTNGEAYMVSGFTSRFLGFGPQLTTAQLRAVNEHRAGKHYLDKEAALDVNKKTIKPVLTETPFVRYFHVGAANDGYWNSFHMAIQLEDIADCLNTLHPSIEFLVLFDHSQGHDRKRHDALDAKTMNKGYGGSNPIMRAPIIESEDGYLGPHPATLKVGDTQSMVFLDADIGPFWMTETERVDRRLDKPTGISKERKKTVKELIADLTREGVSLSKKYTKKQLTEFCDDKGIAIKATEEVVEPGWHGKAKGLYQVLWERGFIDINNLDRYSVSGKKNTLTGEVNETFSMKRLLSRCLDFASELTALQELGQRLGLLVDRTPKFHAEMAGEGIEFSWACSKGSYRRQPLSKKRGRESFKTLVRAVHDTTNVLTLERSQGFARRARAYMCAYYTLNLQEQERKKQGVADGSNVGSPGAHQQAQFMDIERLQKKFRSHRCALDFDKGFVSGIIKEIQID
jgi:hypothetical protein